MTVFLPNHHQQPSFPIFRKKLICIKVKSNVHLIYLCRIWQKILLLKVVFTDHSLLNMKCFSFIPKEGRSPSLSRLCVAAQPLCAVGVFSAYVSIYMPFCESKSFNFHKPIMIEYVSVLETVWLIGLMSFYIRKNFNPWIKLIKRETDTEVKNFMHFKKWKSFWWN